METGGKFYLGRIFDLQRGSVTDQPLLYDPADLTTHAVVVGMTGSGKTGLCIDLLEEAALNGIPALLIDPKGDLANHLLHFPALAPQDFEPWIDPAQARREGLTVAAAAQQTAALWRRGLEEWGILPERIQRLRDAAGYTIYTPGSSSGKPLSIMASFAAPQLDWDANRELLREKISALVTALLGLAGFKGVDPVRSREHILLANLFENAWRQGQDLDLRELILQTQRPPFPRLGVFEINTFFPEKERFELAMALNNILAAPSFQSWLEGDPLDIPALLALPDGRPRHTVFYIAHLSEAERMFFVTLLYSAIESWMRAQPGAAMLRAIVFFDEIFGYLPPVGNPPCKPVMLRLLKQGRAFGVGQVLATQNPADVDYKALSNAGAWFIGRLQTDQDKARLLDGLTAAAEGNLDRARIDQVISALSKRVFLLHNVHQPQPVVFQSRWAMNYLAGPLTRIQVPALNRLAAGEPAAASSAEHAPSPAAPEDPPALDRFQAVPADAGQEPSLEGFLAGVGAKAAPVIGTATPPALPMGAAEYFLPHNLTFTQAFRAAGREVPSEAHAVGILYRPALLAQAQVRFTDRKANLDQTVLLAALALHVERGGLIRWEEARCSPFDPQKLERAPVPGAQFAPLEAPFSQARLLRALQADFLEWVYRSARLPLRVHETLGIYAGPPVSPAEFRQRCAQEARRRRDAEIAKLEAQYAQKIKVLELRLEKETLELEMDEEDLGQRRIEELGTHAENVLSLFSKNRRRISTSLTRRRLTERARADVTESRKIIRSLQGQIQALEAERDRLIQEAQDRWGTLAAQDREIALAPLKKNIFLDLFGVAWFPYHLVRAAEGWMELPGFSAARMD